MIVLEDARDRGSHQRLAKANDIAMSTPAFVQIVSRDLDGGDLEVEQLVFKVARDAKGGESCPGLLGEVVGDLEVNVIRRARSASGDRQGVANERVVRERPSQPTRPRVMR